MVLAHIAGLPVEETLLMVLPTLGMIFFGIRMKLTKCKCGKRGKCCCTKYYA